MYVCWLWKITLQVFRARTSPEAIDLVSRLLEYTPSSRITPLQACAHKFFDELRDPNARLPNNRELPPLFNFTEQGKNVFLFLNIAIENLILKILLCLFFFLYIYIFACLLLTELTILLNFCESKTEYSYQKNYTW